MQLTPGRRLAALFTLALGGFGIGTTEFATMGILPLAAAELVPGFEADPAGGIAHAGWMITAYALGVVVGAPLVSIWAARMSQRTLVLLLVAAFTVANLASGLMPSFELTLVARFVAAIPHGAYFGVASLLAARIMGPGRQGAGIALALSGPHDRQCHRRAARHLARPGGGMALDVRGGRRHLRPHARPRARVPAERAGRPDAQREARARRVPQPAAVAHDRGRVRRLRRLLRRLLLCAPRSSRASRCCRSRRSPGCSRPSGSA